MFKVNKIQILKNEKILLLLIFLLALVLRVFQLGSLPRAFHQDEVMNGYAGRFILLHGQDLYGNRRPVFYFDRFGDFPNVLPMYLSGLSTFVFGVNEFAVRFPIALAGALLVIPVYYLSKMIFEDKRLAVFSALLTAVLPWHIILSRATSEGVLGLTVFSAGILLILKGILKKSRSLVGISFVLFLMTYFLYPSFRILAPLAVMPLIFLKNKRFGKINKQALAITAVLLVLTLAVSMTDWGKGRYLQTSLFHNQNIASVIKANAETLSYDEGSGKVILARIFHNKIVLYGRMFLGQYLSYFSPEFLFLKGGLPDRYFIPHQGLLYFVVGFLFFLLFIRGFGKLQSYNRWYLYYLLLAAPIPAALTIEDTPNIHRAVMLILPLILLAADGFGRLFEFKFKKPMIVFVLAALFFEFIYFWHQYARHTASYKSVLRNDGSKELVEMISQKNGDFEKIIMPVEGTLPLYYLFYTNNFEAWLTGKFRNGLKIDRIDKISFVEDWCPSGFIDLAEFSGKLLVVDQGDCDLKSGFFEVETIYRQDSTRAFRLLTAGGKK